MSAIYKNENAYTMSPSRDRVKIEFTFCPDMVPGAFHDPHDFINWVFLNIPYAETAQYTGIVKGERD